MNTAGGCAAVLFHEALRARTKCKMIDGMDNVRSLVDAFTNQLTMIVERQAIERARMSLESAFGGDGRKGAIVSNGGRRRKLPRQLCPVPGCKDTAAPVFGMVCGKHKDVPKAKIAKYREVRRAKKLKAAT